jgi:hypothetical protein
MRHRRSHQLVTMATCLAKSRLTAATSVRTAVAGDGDATGVVLAGVFGWLRGWLRRPLTTV